MFQHLNHVEKYVVILTCRLSHLPKKMDKNRISSFVFDDFLRFFNHLFFLARLWSLNPKFCRFNCFPLLGKWKVLKNLRFLYKLSFFVINKINLIAFNTKFWKLLTFGKGKRKLTALIIKKSEKIVKKRRISIFFGSPLYSNPYIYRKLSLFSCLRQGFKSWWLLLGWIWKKIIFVNK